MARMSEVERLAALDDLHWCHDGLYRGAEAARRLGIDRRLITQWKATGKIEPVTYEGRHPLYRMSDLQRVERETRNSPMNLKRAVR